MTIATRLYTWLRGAAVGHDAFGNTYYRDKTGATRYAGKREKRWVLYSGEAEATKVPPEWHAWLPHIVKAPPQSGGVKTAAWQQPHLPNLTGTTHAYRPPGHDFGKRAAATG